jgi:hypothetical protein
MAIVILTEHGVQMTKSLQQATTFILVHASYPGLLRSKRLWPGLALRLSNGPWHLLLLKCIGFACYSRSYGFLFSTLHACGLIISVLSLSLSLSLSPILYFMPGPNTLKWITTSSEKKFSTRISMLGTSQLIISLQISSPKVCLQFGFFSYETS